MFVTTVDKKADAASHAALASEKPIRSLTKALSWRVTGSIDTMLLSWLFTGDMAIAAAIGLTEVVTKMVLYYVHERVWNRIPLGRHSDERVQQSSEVPESDRCMTHGLRPLSETE